MRRIIVISVAAMLVAGGFLVGLASLFIASNDNRSQLGVDIAFGTVAGHDVVLVPYQASGPGGLAGMPAYLTGPDSLRVAAVDVVTGDLLWDRLLDKGWPSDEASILAGGSRFGYVATDSGLVVLSLVDGRIQARGANVPGLGESYIASRTAYAYDAVDDAVVMLTTDGRVLTIPVDTDTAQPATSAQRSRWIDELNLPADRSAAATERDPSVKSVVLPDGAEITLGWFGEDTHRELMIDVTTGLPAGGDHGFLVAQTNRQEVRYTLLDPRTGETGASVSTRHTATTSRVAPNGTVVILSGDEHLGVLVLAGLEQMRRVVLGDTDYLGRRM